MFKIRYYDTSSIALFGKDWFMFPYELWGFFSIYVKNIIEMLLEISINLKSTFSNMAILTKSILIIHEHGKFFDLIVSSTISFLSAFLFSLYRILASLAKFMVM
jgi:hypothetical protein